MKTTLEIQNLKCGGCANTITNKLSQLGGIKNIQVNTESNSVSFSYASEDLLKSVKSLLSNIGYPIKGDKNAVTTKVKSFVSCAVGRIS